MLTIRRAEPRDASALGTLGATLMRTHYAFDRQRFLAAGDDAERGYASFLESQLQDDDAVVLVAELEGRLVGYVYAGLEPMSWKELRGPADSSTTSWSKTTSRARGQAAPSSRPP